MKKDLQRQLQRMTLSVVLLLVFSLWQHQFIIEALNANVFLNATIICTFLFGAVITFRNVFELDNELLSFKALQESYNDLLHRDRDKVDPYWRFKRCEQPAIVFTQPRIMWQSYFLISDEMARTGDLRMSAGTMQTLIDGIDAKLDDQRSLTSYLTGLLIFLGLIGTFVGLMITVASVGEIIGDLDLSGKDGTETVQKLLENLKTPLNGMATGFSSSLFGLATSLTLGLLVRFQNLAASSMKQSFEAWLSSVVHITDSDDGKGATISDKASLGFNAQHLRLMYNVAKYSLTSSNRTNRIIDKLTGSVHELGEDYRQHARMTELLAEQVERSNKFQSLMSFHLGRTADALLSHDEIALKLREVDIAINDRLDQLSDSVSRANGHIESLTEEMIRFGQEEEKMMDGELEQLMEEIEKGLVVERERARAERRAENPVGEIQDQLADAVGERK